MTRINMYYILITRIFKHYTAILVPNNIKSCKNLGDFTEYGDVSEVIKFNLLLGLYLFFLLSTPCRFIKLIVKLDKLPHKVKIVIAGNHEVSHLLLGLSLI